jgi:hypothetical protein
MKDLEQKRVHWCVHHAHTLLRDMHMEQSATHTADVNAVWSAFPS